MLTSTFRVTLKVVGDGVDPVAIGFVRVPLDASLAVNIDTLLLNTSVFGLNEGRQSCAWLSLILPQPVLL